MLLKTCQLIAWITSFVVFGGMAFALEPSRELAQLHHTAWTIEDGAPPDIWALAQSPDGYLWLGTGAGLYRFDGVTFEQVHPVSGGPAPSSNVNALFAARNGDIWIGYVTGNISRLRQGKMTTFDLGLYNVPVNQIVEDADGVVWAALKSYGKGGLGCFAKGRWRLVGPEMKYPGGSALDVLASRDGAVWVIANGTLLVLRRGASQFEKTGERVLDSTRVSEAPDGRIWLSSGLGLGPHPVVGGAAAAAARKLEAWPQPRTPDHETVRMIFDRDGALWGTYEVGGVFRIGAPDRSQRTPASLADRTDRFTLKEGLTSDIARPLLEDREGDVWVGTNLGLDRFRATNVVAAPGLPVTSREGFKAAPATGGSIMVTLGDALYLVHPYGRARVLAHPDARPTFVYTDRDSQTWIGLEDGLALSDKRGLRRVAMPSRGHGRPIGWAQDPSGAVWVSMEGGDLFRFSNGTWTRVSTGAVRSPSQLLSDPRRGLWLVEGDQIGLLTASIVRLFSKKDGLSVGKIGTISASGDTLLIGGDYGLARFDGSRFEVLRSERHPILSRISGIVQSRQGDVWLNGIGGVARLSSADLDAAFAHPGRALHYQRLDVRDGLPGVAQQDGDAPTAIEGSDGRIWLVTSHGVAWLDPDRLTRNPIPPPVTIRSLTAGGITYPEPSSIRLGKGESNVRIDYTALSLAIPERVRFRYRLDGVDSSWVEPGARRQAFYTKLKPGHYLFNVIAANNDGVWNLSGAHVNFFIPPTFVQSIWFSLLIVLILGALLWALYYLRLQQVTGRMREDLEERLGERERIARELHDTLLQGFQGLMLRFQSIAETIPATHATRQMLEDSLDRADKVLVEGRDRVVSLRVDDGPVDLPAFFAATINDLAEAEAPRFAVVVEGEPRRLHPIVYEELSRIGVEAISNALRHAHPREITVSMLYDRRRFSIHFRDDGVGIDPSLLKTGGKYRHFGLIGMLERAERIRSRLEISSRPGKGTEIVLTVPGAVAYASAAGPLQRRARLAHLGD